jgi:DHA1 family tetracycline resistance protein-like MFS transporter
MKSAQSSAKTVTDRSTTSWRNWIEPWYLAYALLGVTVAGLVPILLPLAVSQSGNAADVGLVMAVLSLGGLMSPLWGGLADRYRAHRWLLVGGVAFTAIGLAFFPFTTSVAAWLGLALLQGASAAAAATVANLFVVENHPKAEWDERIGWLQTFYGGGQVAGLLLAGLLSQLDLRVGLLVAAGLVAAAVIPGWFKTRVPPQPLKDKPTLRHPARHSEGTIVSPQRLFHYLSRNSLRQLTSTLRSPFGAFIGAWLLAFAGSATVFSLYPVLMQAVFGITPGLSSIGFAVAAGLGLALYSPAGNWSDRFGSTRVLRLGFGIRVLAFGAIFGLGVAHGSSAGWPALLGFTFVVLSWSLLSVSGTALAADLSSLGEGEGLGIFNAATAVAGTLGAALGGWVAGQWGYAAVSIMATVGVALGLALTLAIRSNRPVRR